MAPAGPLVEVWWPLPRTRKQWRASRWQVARRARNEVQLQPDGPAAGNVQHQGTGVGTGHLPDAKSWPVTWNNHRPDCSIRTMSSAARSRRRLLCRSQAARPVLTGQPACAFLLLTPARPAHLRDASGGSKRAMAWGPDDYASSASASLAKWLCLRSVTKSTSHGGIGWTNSLSVVWRYVRRWTKFKEALRRGPPYGIWATPRSLSPG